MIDFTLLRSKKPLGFPKGCTKLVRVNWATVKLSGPWQLGVRHGAPCALQE